MYVVITTEQINGRDSRTCDLLPTRCEAMEFARSQGEDLTRGQLSARVEVHRVDHASLIHEFCIRGAPQPTASKRGCRR